MSLIGVETAHKNPFSGSHIRESLAGHMSGHDVPQGVILPHH